VKRLQSALTHISVRGVRTHNLKNIDIDIPHNQLVVITGLSGSGKSSLAFDTIYAEGQRRYVESLSSYARQFLSVMEKPDLDSIEGLSPAISIDQKSSSHNPRSTVGTVTEIYDYLRLLYARVGTPYCPTHKQPLHAQSVKEMVSRVSSIEEGMRLAILAPVVRQRKGEYLQLLEGLQGQGFIRARIDGEIYSLEDTPTLDANRKHTIEVVVDRFKSGNDGSSRISESIETALRLANGLVGVLDIDSNGKKINWLLSNTHACPHCGFALSELEPRIFSFNSPLGACKKCDGIGVLEYIDPALVITDEKLSLADGCLNGWDERASYYFNILKAVADFYGFSTHTPFNKLSDEHQKIILYGSGKQRLNLPGGMYSNKRVFEGVIPNLERRYNDTEIKQVREALSVFRVSNVCAECSGGRLNLSARNVFIQEKNLPYLTGLSIADLHQFFQQLELEGASKIIADKIIKEIISRLSFLVNVGLGYLSLSRSANTLSGGEAQRIRLASQVGAGLVGVMYVLDEPSIGLHQRDNDRLLKTLYHLRDIGNTVIVVEHDEDTVRNADCIFDIGPMAGEHGGEVVAQGSVKDICHNKDSITGQYLSGKRKIEVPKKRLKASDKKIRIIDANTNNLQKVSVDLPVGLTTCVTGVSGSGKSTLINRTLQPVAAHRLNRATLTGNVKCKIEGLEHFEKVVTIDQSPIGRTPRSNPATYVGLFTVIRDLFAATQDARARGYKAGRFSFNVKGGRCESCQGDGMIRVEMHFLPDVFVMCDHCQGKRYNDETLTIKYKEKNIAEVLAMTVDEARAFFSSIPMLARRLDMLHEVGLSYIRLGQSATTLSGGEAQRVKLSKELSRRSNGQTLYILDEPTTGLHFYDIDLLIQVITKLRDQGNTIVIIEHNLDVIKTADWIIDLGPEGGDGGGKIIAKGTPEEVAKVKGSFTGQFLKKVLN
jgi:excinuclease ABC subunit A